MSTETTAQALANITDAGLFERLATSVLRAAHPEQYASLAHPGVNVAGKTVKSPLDGICFVQGANLSHMIAVHHTIAARDDLEKKWLHDPSTVKSRKGSKPTAPPGDVIKTARLVTQERIETPDLLVTLALTTNEEPSEELIRKVAAVGRTYDIEIDIWSRSRLSDFLDNQPTGQWIRRSFLNIEQEQLSSELLHELSVKSLEIQRNNLLDDSNAWIPRQLDSLLSNALSRDTTFLIAGSGSGKSVACFRQLVTHIENGGFGLVLSHETVDLSLTLEQAVMTELRHLHPSLATISPAPSSFCSSAQPLLLVIEDINRSGKAQLLLEKLASWSQAVKEHDQRKPAYWRILCPLWPEIFTSLPTQTRNYIQSLILISDSFTEDEGCEAVLVRARLDNRSLSLLDANAVAQSLGNDPLLIALHDFDKTPDPSQTIGHFIEGSLSSTAAGRQENLPSEYLQAIRSLGKEMLFRRRINPQWNEVITWEGLQGEPIQLLRHVINKGDFIRQTGSLVNSYLSFRHDRVRDWILVDTAADLESRNLLEDEVLSEPYFAEVMGKAIAQEGTNLSFVNRVKSAIPLALFHAFRVIGETSHPHRDAILKAIDDWFAEPSISEPSNLYLRLEALAMLSETDASEVPAIVRRFPDYPLNATVALLRNGDVSGGIDLCFRVKPGCNAPWRDRQIEHAKGKYSEAFIESLAGILRQTDLTSQDRIGALRLCGHLANPKLALAVEASWNADNDQLNHLDSYLWAFAQCCADDPVRFLEPVCNTWASLPNQPKKEGYSSTRVSFAAYEVRWAFRRWPPCSAIDYFIQRGSQEDLEWPITYMLHGIDHPKAIDFVINKFAAIERTGSTLSIQAEDEWQRTQEVGRPMSRKSRNFLLSIWQNSTSDTYLQSQAFRVWAATKDLEDLGILREAKSLDALKDSVLRQRLIRGDLQAIPQFIQKLANDDEGIWWQYGRHIWTSELLEVLSQALDKRSNLAKKIWFESIEIDWIIPELILRMDVDVSEKILLKHWGHLRFSPGYVQAALYVSTPRLLGLVHISVNECPEPRKMLEYVSWSFGVRTVGHPGVRSESQLRLLAPYLHLLDSSCIDQFWQECNDRGWFDTRRELFDDLLQPPYPQPKWEPNQAKISLDEMIEVDRLVWLEHWIDEFLKADVSWSEIFLTMQAWMEERKTFEAFKVLASAVKYRGSREDLSALRICEDMPKLEAAQISADTEFAVKRRSLF
ncbi:MAG: hypothetical protein KME14_22920 [Tildeniella torsiva UHER 1998/13D]|jgi:hypothetical protein|nr:hypothetical protein [Tildeniella torsiva UHER 1998/13D]